MSDNKRPPGYVQLTIHELAAGHKGKRGTAFDYVFSLDSRAVDDSVLASSAARAATGGSNRNGPKPERFEGGHQPRSERGDSRGGRRGSRRSRNRRGGFPNQDGSEGSWGESGGNGAAGAEGGNGSHETFRVGERPETTGFDEE